MENSNEGHGFERRSTDKFILERLEENNKLIDSLKRELEDIKRNQTSLSKELEREEKTIHKDIESLEDEIKAITKERNEESKRISDLENKQNSERESRLELKGDVKEIKSEIKILSSASQKNAIYISLIVSIVGTMIPFAIKMFLGGS